MEEDNDFDRYINKAQVRRTSEIKYHYDNAPGSRYLFLDNSMVPGSNIYSIVRAAKEVSARQGEYVDVHSHKVDSVFLFIGDNDDLTGLTAEVAMENEIHIVTSPASVLIPKGVRHSYRLIGGSGKFVNFVLSGNYNESLE